MNWKNVEGYEGVYEISDTGLLRNTKRGKIVSPTLDRYGYVRYGLHKSGKMVCAQAHRLVAKAFIPNPDQKPQVNHINGIKTDNTASNLEWCTNSENHRHRFQVLGRVPNNRLLSREEVFEILRTKIAKGSRNTNHRQALADRYQVSVATIKAVRSGRNYSEYFNEYKALFIAPDHPCNGMDAIQLGLAIDSTTL